MGDGTVTQFCPSHLRAWSGAPASRCPWCAVDRLGRNVADLSTANAELGIDNVELRVKVEQLQAELAAAKEHP